MVTEIRHVMFESDEVQQALTDFQRHRKRPLPPGTVVEVKMWSDPEAGCALEWIPHGLEERRTRVFSADELGAALIHYCMREKIPLPARASKVLQLIGDRMGLIVTIGGRKKKPTAQ